MLPRTSRKVRRFEKEAILRTKDYEYRREQSDNLLSKLHHNTDDEDYEKHRRHLLMRRIQQVLREDQSQADPEEKYNDLKPSYDFNKKSTATSTLTSASTPSTATGTTATTGRTYRSSLLNSSESRDDRSTSTYQKSTSTSGKYSSLNKTY